MTAILTKELPHIDNALAVQGTDCKAGLSWLVCLGLSINASLLKVSQAQQESYCKLSQRFLMLKDMQHLWD